MTPDPNVSFDAAASLWLWQTGNLCFIILAVEVLLFVGFYGTQFPWWKYPLGVGMMLVALAILAQATNSFIGVYVDPQSAFFWQLPPSPAEWRPLSRFLTQLFTVLAVSNVLRILWERRFHPERGPLAGIPDGPFKPRRTDTGPVSTTDPVVEQ